jgi:hypothetical protein
MTKSFEDRLLASARYNELRMWAVTVQDLQRTRIKLGNRDKAFASIFDLGSADETPLAPYREQIHEEERQAMAELENLYRELVPLSLYQWVEDTKGLGHPSMARLLGAIGDPLVAIPMRSNYVKGRYAKPEPDGPPYLRTVSSLWAYCGHGAPLHYEKSMTQDEAKAVGNPTARRLTRVIAKGLLKTRNEDYRVTFDAAKANGIAKGWKLIKAQTHAERLVGKRMLLELWIAAGGPELMASAPPLRAA